VDVGEGYRFRISDNRRFIRKLPHHPVASFRATLEEARGADLLLHVIDAAHPSWQEQLEVVEAVLEEMGLYERRAESGARPPRTANGPFTCSTRRISFPTRGLFLAQARERYRLDPPPRHFRIPHFRSAVTGSRGFTECIANLCQALRPVARIRCRSMTQAARGAAPPVEVLQEAHVDGVVEVTARVEAWLLGKLRRDGITVEIGE